MTDAPKRPPAPKLPGTIELGPDFVGIKDADGNVLVDDTAFFRHREMVRPFEEALAADARVCELREKLRVWMMVVAKSDPDAERQIGLLHLQLEQAMLVVCAAAIATPPEETFSIWDDLEDKLDQALGDVMLTDAWSEPSQLTILPDAIAHAPLPAQVKAKRLLELLDLPLRGLDDLQRDELAHEMLALYRFVCRRGDKGERDG